MGDATYYRDHWVTVEPERLDAYEELFRWRPQLEPTPPPRSRASTPRSVRAASRT
jgi:hypothetical protein